MTERDAWDIYFANICAMRLHPGYTKNFADPGEWVEKCATVATAMLHERRKKWPLGSQQPLPSSEA